MVWLYVWTSFQYYSVGIGLHCRYDLSFCGWFVAYWNCENRNKLVREYWKMDYLLYIRYFEFLLARKFAATYGLGSSNWSLYQRLVVIYKCLDSSGQFGMWITLKWHLSSSFTQQQTMGILSLYSSIYLISEQSHSQ